MAEEESLNREEDRRGSGSQGSGGSAPGPSTESFLRSDPKTLTTQALRREIGLLRELVDVKLGGLEAISKEKFDAIERRFVLVEQQRLEQKQDTKAAVDAALVAQKESFREQTSASELSIAKSENATTKQLEQLGNTFQSTVSGVTVAVGDVKERILRVEGTAASFESASTTISELKDRLSRVENIKVGVRDARDSTYLFVGALVGVVGAAVGIFIAVQ